MTTQQQQRWPECLNSQVWDLWQQPRDEDTGWHISDGCMYSLCTLWHGGMNSHMYLFMCGGPNAVNMALLRAECKGIPMPQGEDNYSHQCRAEQYAMIQYTKDHDTRD